MKSTPPGVAVALAALVLDRLLRRDDFAACPETSHGSLSLFGPLECTDPWIWPIAIYFGSCCYCRPCWPWPGVRAATGGAVGRAGAGGTAPRRWGDRLVGGHRVPYRCPGSAARGRIPAPPLPPGRDVVLLVDDSRSMAAEDAVPDRLGVAVEAASSLVARSRQPGNRVAVVAFAGRGVLRCPLTEDLGAVATPCEHSGRAMSARLAQISAQA